MHKIKNLFHQHESDLMTRFKHITSIISMCDPLMEKIKGKDIVILLGNTKAGKSTVCNYIIGNELTAVEGRKPNTFTITATPGEHGPAIGRRRSAETTMPTIWSDTQIPEILVDAPGFEDNRGEEQDIANFFYIKKMIQNCRRVKFLLICNINEILNDNTNAFKNFVDKVYSMLPTLENLRQGVCLVFTKDSDYTSEQRIRELLEEIYNDSNIRIQKSILQSFIYSDSNIAFLRAPTAKGLVKKDIGITLINKIKKLYAIPRQSLPVMKPTVSNNSLVFLLFAEKRLSENPLFFEILKAVLKDFEKKTRVDVLGTIKTLRIAKDELSRLKKLVQSVKKSVEKDESLQNILDCLNQLSSECLRERMKTADLKTILEFIGFINDIIDRPGNNVLFKLHFEMLLESIETSVQSALLTLQATLDELSLEQLQAELENLERALKEETAIYQKKKIDDLEKETKGVGSRK